MRKPKGPKAADQTADQTKVEQTDAGEDAGVATEPDAEAGTAGDESPAKDATGPAAKSTKERAAEPAKAAEPAPQAKAPDAKTTEAKTAGAKVPEVGAPAQARGRIEPQEPPRPDEHAEEEHAHEEEPAHRSFAATALMLIVGILVVASLTLWAAPKLAPHLPANVAKYLLPGQVDTESRLARLDAALSAETAAREAAVAASNAEIAELANQVAAAGDASQTEAALAAAQAAADAAGSAQDAAEGAAADAAALAGRIDAIEAELASLGAQFAAVSDALSAASTASGATAPETAATLATLSARLDSLERAVGDTSATQALEQQLAALADRVAAVETTANEARDAQAAALDEVSSALEAARLQGAVDVLASRMTGGLPYAGKLAEIAALTGSTPPEALSAAAETGLATADTLDASFARHAQAAVAADVRARAGEGTVAQALGWLRALVSSRPTTEQEGDSAGAITSRIAGRIEEGQFAEALAEAEALSGPAQEGLGRWLAQLRARVAAEAALDAWRTEIGAGG